MKHQYIKFKGFKPLKFLYKDVTQKSYMVSLLNSKEFMAVFKRFGKLFTRILFEERRLPSRLHLIHCVGTMILRFAKHHGSLTTVKYLKACNVAVQRKLGNCPLKSLREIEPDLPLPRLTSSGLPRFIPIRDRREIQQLTTSVIRWWLTIFSVYRIISCTGSVKLETITNPFSGKSEFLLELSSWLLANSKSTLRRFQKGFTLRPSLGLEKILKASPSAKESWKGFLVDAFAWKGRTELTSFLNFGQVGLNYDLFMVWKDVQPPLFGRGRSDPAYFPSVWKQLSTGNLFSWEKMLEFLSKSVSCTALSLLGPGSLNKVHGFERVEQESLWRSLKHLPKTLNDPVPLGQLAFKEEAAGKIRVFAMVDVWTQTALRPLHDWLFDLFKNLPNDSTHDQDEGFKRAALKAVKHGSAYCFDLSAATDRLPIKLQSAILDSLFGHIEPDVDTGVSYGQAWANLLIKRAYKTPSSYHGEGELHYSVGQPMGALSSWGMLNLCHHLILQFINFRLYNKSIWYDNYEVLGDDIVIFDSKVATLYLRVMEDCLGVKCNEAKSLISPKRPIIEFAKRIAIAGEEVSAFSWREARSFDTLMGRASLASNYILKRGVKFPMRAMKVILGPSYTPLFETRLFGLVHLASVLVNQDVLPFQTLMKMLKDPKNPKRFFGARMLPNMKVGRFESLILNYVKGLPLPIFKWEPQIEVMHRIDEGFFRGFLEDSIVAIQDVILKTQSQGALSFTIFEMLQHRVPLLMLEMLFYPGVRYQTKLKRVDLFPLDLEGLVKLLASLENLKRDVFFYKGKVSRVETLENSLKVLKNLERSKSHGSISVLMNARLL